MMVWHVYTYASYWDGSPGTWIGIGLTLEGAQAIIACHRQIVPQPPGGALYFDLVRQKRGSS